MVGIILFFVWRGSPNPDYASLGRTCGIIALVIIVLNCLCFGVLSVTGGLGTMFNM